MIEFILNNQIIRTSVNSGVTLLDFIRDHQQLKGTKIGCREGDCGACTTLVGSITDSGMQYQSITSCISPLGNAHGKHIVTIEGINLPKTLNSVQQAMADNYATQCGFCTPGFVVSMTGFALKPLTPTQSSFANCKDAVSGNICRCTGYKSIEKAALEIEDQLQLMQGPSQIDWLVEKRFIPKYFQSIPERLEALHNIDVGASPNNNAGKKEDKTSSVKVANGTDLYVKQADKMAEVSVHHLVHESDLSAIAFTKNTCTLGANTTVTEILENERLQSLFPRLGDFLKLVSSEQIRNMGTIAGNFVNASPIGDMSIFFLALNANLTIQKSDGSTRQVMLQSFHQDYKVYDLEKNEILKSISFDIPGENVHFNFEKVSKRTHLDIASVNAAASITIKNDVIYDAHFSVGGVAAIPKYLSQTNEFLVGKSVHAKTVLEAEAIMQSEIAPISDVRGTAQYKRLLARQLFFAHFIELFPNYIQLHKLIAG